MAASVADVVGFLRLKGGREFDRNLKGRIDRAKKAFLNFNTLIAGAGVGLVFKQMNEQANILATSQRQLSAIARLTGASFTEMRDTSETSQKQFSLNTKQAAGLTIELTKLQKKAGDSSNKLDLMTRLLDLAAAQGLDAEAALVAVKQAILGIDEGTDKLFQKNPSVLYKEFAESIGTSAGKLTDQQKAMALLVAIQKDGVKVQGEYNDFLKDSIGKQAMFSARLKDAAAVGGQFLQKVLDPIIETGTKFLQFLTDAPPAIQTFIAAAGSVLVFFKLLGPAIAALLPALGPVGWVVIGLGALATAFALFNKKTGESADRIKEFRTELKLLTLEGAEEKVANLRLELEKLEEQAIGRILQGPRFENENFELTKQNLRNLVKAKKEEIRIAEEHLEKLKKKTQQGTDEIKKVEIASQDEIQAHLFETNAITRAEYLDFLKKRLADLTKFSTDWIDLNKEIFDLEREIQEDRLAGRIALNDEMLEAEREFQEQMNVGMNEFIANAEAQAAAAVEAGRRHLQEMQALTRRMAEFVQDAIGGLFVGVADSIREGDNALKAAFKTILLTTLRAIQRFFLLAKIQTILQSISNPLAGLKAAAPLILATGLIEAAKSQIASLAEGGAITQPTLALVHGSRQKPEVFAPAQDFEAFANKLIDKVTGSGSDGNLQKSRRSPSNVFHFNSPFADRKSMQRFMQETFIPAQRRERKRAGRRD